VPSFGVAAGGFLLRAALMNMASPLYSAFAMEHTTERERGAVNSVMTLMWEVGWTVGPYLSGLVQARWGFSPLFVLTAMLYAGAISLTWLFFRKTEAETRLAAAAGQPCP
jgi:predicted MFS family arabinose efflux permease